MRADNTHPVIAAARRRAEQTRQRAIAALRRMDATGQRVTFDSVAREADVSRSWLYSQDDLRADIERLRDRQGPTGPPQHPPPTGNGPPTPRCYAAWKPPPAASRPWRKRTGSSATPSPAHSVNTGPRTSSDRTTSATRRRGPRRGSSDPAERQSHQPRRQHHPQRITAGHTNDHKTSSR